MLAKQLNTHALLSLNMRLSAVVSTQARDFGAKKKKVKTSDSEMSASETVDEEPVATVHRQEPVAVVHDNSKPWMVAPALGNLDKALFAPFSLGDVKRVDSTPDNKAPSYEDTIEGRYANVLFTTASQKEALYDVYEDMMYLSELYTHSEMFRQFTENGGVGAAEIRKLNKALLETASFNDISIHFLTVLAENKRLVFIKEIAGKYQKLYQQFNKEEKITIISAETLTDAQQGEVLSALQANPQNTGKAFTIEY